MEGYTKRKLKKELPDVAIIHVRGRSGNPILGFLRWGIDFFSAKNAKDAVEHTIIYKKAGFRNSKGKVVGNVIEALFEGVKITKIENYINDHDGLLVMRNKKLEKPAAIAKFTIAAERSVGRGYDFAGIGGFIKKFFGGKQDQEDGKNFCSELAYECCGTAGVKAAGEESPSPYAMKEWQLDNPGKKEGWELYDFQNLGTEFFEAYELKPIA